MPQTRQRGFGRGRRSEPESIAVRAFTAKVRILSPPCNRPFRLAHKKRPPGKEGCIKHKLESKRLRFVLIIIICLTDFCRYWRPVRPSPTGSKTGAEHLFQKQYWRPAEIAPKGPARKANCGAKEKAITEFFQSLKFAKVYFSKTENSTLIMVW